MVARAGVEPATSRFSVARSYQLSYRAMILLSLLLATQTGLEPATSAVTGRRANQLRYWAFPRIEELYVCSSPLAWQQTLFDALSNR